MRSWSDRFLAAPLRGDPDVLSRARLTVELTTVLVATAVGYAVFYETLVHFRAGTIIVLAGGSAGALVLLVLRLRPWLRFAAHLLTTVLYVALVALMCHEGGLASLVTPWLVTPPIFAILLLGRRDAFAWSAIGVLTMFAFYTLESNGMRFPIDYPSEWTTRLTVGTYAGLVLCVSVLIFVFEGIRARAQARAEAANAALERLAYQDALTGLANRARFVECLEGALRRAHDAVEPSRVAVLMLDLDGFKSVNDSLGHAAGDTLLVQVAARLLSATRGCDLVTRLGGDEFAVLVENARSDDDVAIVARRIVQAIGEPFALPRSRVHVGASVGVSRARTADAAAVLHDADVAMYRAKSLGRGRWTMFIPEMDDARASAA